jgi:hypothetical protein
MALDNDPRPVLRRELERVFKNQRVIRAFEKIFELIPPEFINQQIQIDALNLISEFAGAQANANAAVIERLTSAIEQLALAPIFTDVPLLDDLKPRDELGTMAAQQADAVDIKAGAVVATLADDTTSLITSSVALTNGAGAAAGTLLNSPAAGNPTKWVPINDNGTTRYIPSW